MYIYIDTHIHAYIHTHTHTYGEGGGGGHLLQGFILRCIILSGDVNWLGESVGEKEGVLKVILARRSRTWCLISAPHLYGFLHACIMYVCTHAGRQAYTHTCMHACMHACMYAAGNVTMHAM